MIPVDGVITATHRSHGVDVTPCQILHLLMFPPITPLWFETVGSMLGCCCCSNDDQGEWVHNREGKQSDTRADMFLVVTILNNHINIML